MSYCNYSFNKRFKILWLGRFQSKLKLTFDGDAHIYQLSKRPDKAFYDGYYKEESK